MKAQEILHMVFRLFMSAVLGVLFGLVIWQLMNFLIPSVNTASTANLVGSVLFTSLPFFAMAWVISIVIFGVLLSRPSSRPLAIKGLITTLTLWLVTTLLLLGGIYSTGTAYLPSFINLLAQTAYVAAGLSFGFIVAPMLIIRAMQFGIAKALHPNFVES